MLPNYHLRAPMGCPTCGHFLGGDKRRLTTDEFIARGLTNLTVWERYPQSSDQARITIVKEWPYEQGADAATHERGVLHDYDAFRYSGPPVLNGVGVTEVFACDVLGLDGGDPPAGLSSRCSTELQTSAGRSTSLKDLTSPHGASLSDTRHVARVGRS